MLQDGLESSSQLYKVKIMQFISDSEGYLLFLYVLKKTKKMCYLEVTRNKHDCWVKCQCLTRIFKYKATSELVRIQISIKGDNCKYTKNDRQHSYVPYMKFKSALLLLILLDPFQLLNSVSNDKVLDQYKLKAFADDKIDVAEMMISLLDRVEDTVGKGEMMVTSIFSFSHGVFQSLLP